jgi:hypothetical protein
MARLILLFRPRQQDALHQASRSRVSRSPGFTTIMTSRQKRHKVVDARLQGPSRLRFPKESWMHAYPRRDDHMYALIYPKVN